MRDDAPDAWTRSFDIVLPLAEPQKWGYGRPSPECLIKSNFSHKGERIYHMPDGLDYGQRGRTGQALVLRGYGGLGCGRATGRGTKDSDLPGASRGPCGFAESEKMSQRQRARSVMLPKRAMIYTVTQREGVPLSSTSLREVV
jgi:hypothetical protein